MEKIDWKDKLLNAKFWAALVSFVTVMLVAFNISEVTIGHVVAVISAASILIAYIIGEGLVEVNRMKIESERHAAELDSDLAHHELYLEEMYLMDAGYEEEEAQK